jgi:hypothetical protein
MLLRPVPFLVELNLRRPLSYAARESGVPGVEFLADLVVLAEHATESTAGEENRAGAARA